MKRFFKEGYRTRHGKEDKNIFNRFKDTKFYKVIAVEQKELKDCGNVKYINLDEIKI